MKPDNQLWRIVMAVVCLVIVGGQSASAARTQDGVKTRLDEQALQWILEVPEAKWSSELKSLAGLFEDEQYTAADAVMDDWLKRDFDGALLALPAMAGFFTHYRNHSLAPVFSKHLGRIEGPERIKILAVLDFSNAAVQQVGFRVMLDWWNQDRASMRQWIQQTPCFFEELYMEELWNSIRTDKKGIPALAALFYSLDIRDARRLRFLPDIVQDWLEYDPDAAIDFVRTAAQARREEKDMGLDKALMQLGYFFANIKKYEEALHWAGQVKDLEERELGTRNFCLNISTEAEKEIFVSWYKIHPIEIEDLRQQVDEKLSSIGVPDTKVPVK